MPYKYSKPNSPFNFLGHFSETQRDNFKAWVTEKTQLSPKIQLHHQIRAQQLRKSAGLLEAFYTNLTPSFKKEAWAPGPDGHFLYPFQDDHAPMLTVSKVKERLQPQFQHDDEAVFQMNHIRLMIERAEDEAQYAKQASAEIPSLLQDIDGFFEKGQYETVLVKDKSDIYKDGPRFRVHQLDEPTTWEKEQRNRGGGASVLKEPAV
jgi:hypothetical protein